jgi:hypothetical protein
VSYGENCFLTGTRRAAENYTASFDTFYDKNKLQDYRCWVYNITEEANGGGSDDYQLRAPAMTLHTEKSHFLYEMRLSYEATTQL